MKIRAYLVTCDGRTDPIKGYMLREEPPLGVGGWCSYHYAQDAMTGVVFVRYDEAVFDPVVLTELAGVSAVPPEKADRAYPEAAKAKRDNVQALIEQRGGALDESKLSTWEDSVVELMRRNGSPQQTTLRATTSQRTRQWLDEHE